MIRSKSPLALLCAGLLAANSFGAPARTIPPGAIDHIMSTVRARLTLDTVRLWEGAAPNATGSKPQDIPTLTIFIPDGVKLSGAAVVVVPGGGYASLASGKEGREVADWFAAHGVTAFVLTYRLTTAGYRHPTQLLDAQRAIRWVRANAAKYGIDPARVGMMGFSAGGHLTAMAETHFDAGNRSAPDPIDRFGSRPDFAILCYAPVTIVAKNGLNGLLEPNAPPEAYRDVSPALSVSPQSPPTFIFQTTADQLVSPLNATRFYDALYAAKVPVEAHIFANGHHGEGLGFEDPALSVWPTLLQNWMRGQGLLSTNGASPGTPGSNARP